jgi:hypothetical protein
MLGVEKIGKSSFGAEAPKPIFIPIAGEEGIDDLECKKWDDPVPSSFEDVLSCITSLYQGEHDFKFVVIDSSSALEPLIWRTTCQRCPDKNGNPSDGIEKVHGGYSKGYIEALTEWGILLNGLDALRNARGMGSIIIGHVVPKRFDDPSGMSYDCYQWDIHHKAAAKLMRWADCILFMNRKPVVIQEKDSFKKDTQKGKAPNKANLRDRRFIFTQKRPSHPGGGRGIYGKLSYEIEVTADDNWGAFQRAVVSATKS